MNSRTGSTQTGGALSSALSVHMQDLPFDLKRMLRVQWKELINCIEDAQLHLVSDQPGESLECGKPREDFPGGHKWAAA